MYRDFSKYIVTEKDKATFRNWVRGLAIFYGLAGFLVVSFLTLQVNHTDTQHNLAAAPVPNTVASAQKVGVH